MDYRQKPRKLAKVDKACLKGLKAIAQQLHWALHIVPNPERDLALLKLDEAVLWAVKGFTK